MYNVILYSRHGVGWSQFSFPGLADDLALQIIPKRRDYQFKLELSVAHLLILFLINITVIFYVMVHWEDVVARCEDMVVHREDMVAHWEDVVIHLRVVLSAYWGDGAVQYRRCGGSFGRCAVSLG